VVVAELAVPCRKLAAQAFDDRPPAIELDAVALAVVEADGLDVLEALERPGEAGGRVLAAGKKD